MRKTLTDLSKKYHQDQQNVDNDILSVLPYVNGSNNYEESLSMLANMTLNSEITENIFQQAQKHNCLTEQIYTAKIKSNPSEGLRLIRQMIDAGIQPHIRTFLAAIHPNV